MIAAELRGHAKTRRQSTQKSRQREPTHEKKRMSAPTGYKDRSKTMG